MKAFYEFVMEKWDNVCQELFQLVLKDSPDSVACQYGKIGYNIYALDSAALLPIMLLPPPSVLGLQVALQMCMRAAIQCIHI